MVPGDRLPAWVGVAVDGGLSTPDSQAGRAALILLDNNAAPGLLAPLVAAAAAGRAALADAATDLFLVASVSTGAGAWRAGPAVAHGVRVVLSPGAFLLDCDVAEGEATAVLIDRDRRVVSTGDAVASLVRLAGTLPRETPRRVRTPAPVLAIPRLLDPALCAALIARSGSAEAASGGSGARLRHHDLVLDPQEALHREVADAIARRCVPDLARAFQFRSGGIERLVVARTDPGCFQARRFRDDAGPASAHHRFVLSVNLNAGAYEGGFLQFPAYNDHEHQPATGEGLVFSAAVLHEVAPVTRGTRYALRTRFRAEAGGA